MSYYEANQDFIANNICVEKDVEENNCQGHCFLEDKVGSHDDNEDNRTPFNVLVNEFLPNLYLPIKADEDNPTLILKSEIKLYQESYSYLYSQQFFKPPRFS